MKKYWKLLLCAAGIGLFAACEDVPEPYNIPTEGNTPTPVVVEPTGTGTLEDPFNAVAAIQAAKALPSGEESQVDYYIRGVVSSVRDSYSSTYGNGTFYISEDGSASNQFYVYRALYLGNQKYSSGDNVEEGDTVVVCGKITNFGGNTPETVQNQAYLYSLKKGTGATPSPVVDGVGSGTKEDPYDVPTTIKLIAAGPPATKIYTKGIVSKIDEIDTGSFGNATYYISNDGTTADQLEVYRGYGLGGAKFTSTDDLKVGDEVIVYGQVVYYNNRTMEFTQGSEIYSLNGETSGGGSEPSGEVSGNGTKENPYNVAAAIANNSGTAWVTGYIVGWVDGQTLSSGAQFNGNSTSATNLLIADNADETNVANCLPVQLPAGEVRTALNLKDNPGNYKKQVKLYGSLEKYFGTAGLKTVTEYVLDGSGNNDDPDPTPSGEAKGSGTLADPYNSVAANNIANALAADAKTNEAYYIKGKVVSVTEQFSTQYGNVTFYLSDDGTTTDQFYVFRALYLGNQKWVEGNATLKAGDEVIVYAKLTNYKGNTPETVQGDGYIYSLNGKTADDNSGDNSGDDSGDDTVEGDKITPDKDGNQTVIFSGFSANTFQIVNDYTQASAGTQLRILSLDVTYADGNSESVKMTDLGLENGTALETHKLGDLTLTFSKGEGSTAPAFYTGGGGAARMYAKNTLTIKGSKAMTKIVVNCTDPDSKNYNGNEQLYGIAGK